MKLGYLRQASVLALAATVLVHAPAIAAPQNAASPTPTSADQPPASGPAEAAGGEIVVTGSRIPRTSLTSTSPVASTTAQDIKLQSALTVEDFSTKLPQLAGGVRQASQGSDAFGAQVLDLRNFGQSRSLVLLDGTRAVPFSFRNSVDVNALPASLIKRVDVLTGGAAAVYGADAVAGVVNFILNDDFKGVQASASSRFAEHGGKEYGGSVMFGTGLGDRGHVVVAMDYTQRELTRSGTRDWAITPNSTIPSIGGVFTDVASGRKFGFTDSGQFTTTPAATSNISATYPLIEPLKRINAAALFNYEITPTVEVYGRALYTNARTQESGTPGPNPPTISQTVGINATNPFLTSDIRNQLTFVNGVAQVNVSRSLAELGLITYHTERNTFQGQLGLRGPITGNIKWNVYGQYGRSTENSPITGDGLVTNAAGVNNFALNANTANIFGPNSSSLATALGTTINGFDRKRDQLVTSANLSGTLADLFSLPAGPIGFAVGAEYRRETAAIVQDSALLTGNTFREGVQAAYTGEFDVKELYGELLVPVLHDVPLIKKLDLGGAYRYSDYNLFGTHGTWKAEVNWQVDSNIRLRGTYQRVLRAPNFGEFAATTSSLPFNNLITVARLTPRYAGDPCVIGTGNAAQCARLGAPAVGSANSLAPSYLEGNYYYGGNPDIKPEVGTTKTAGVVFTPTFAPRLTLTVDWYELNLKGAVGVIQPVAAITSCYITNPTASNPLCALVTRDPANGHFLDAYVNNQNLGRIVQRGIDIAASYTIKTDWLPGSGVRLSYQGNIVTSYTIQANPTVTAIQCKGTFGATCSSDGTTLVQPDYRHNASVSWLFGRGIVQVNWNRIGKVKNSAAGATDTIAAQNTFDLSASYQLNRVLTLSGGIYNFTDKDPPFVASGGVFNTFPDTYDVTGRTYGISLTARF
ncbi:outer membrane receptor protein involved in Fe transport [Sphingomonas vulcanisoli]|uniref:Outer membrane receptor protein involved in Fe transport n=1 Tax=Sphingomonas vulcanisoli TaxID=1658060 RepID=A0ABX0TMH9_9SPHN|nr:TonB-dependent receptor [Sphingomonas vulcanisoli]NIJ06733.1 outer membrane receptor protein involved in Fe transport [Sphingomonas vulcanisoli]